MKGRRCQLWEGFRWRRSRRQQRQHSRRQFTPCSLVSLHSVPDTWRSPGPARRLESAGSGMGAARDKSWHGGPAFAQTGDTQTDGHTSNAANKSAGQTDRQTGHEEELGPFKLPTQVFDLHPVFPWDARARPDLALWSLCCSGRHAVLPGSRTGRAHRPQHGVRGSPGAPSECSFALFPPDHSPRPHVPHSPYKRQIVCERERGLLPPSLSLSLPFLDSSTPTMFHPTSVEAAPCPSLILLASFLFPGSSWRGCLRECSGPRGCHSPQPSRLPLSPRSRLGIGYGSARRPVPSGSLAREVHLSGR